MIFATVTIVLVIISGVQSSMICDNDNSVDLSSGTQTSNGDIYLDGIRYKQSEWYQDNVTGVVKGCICNKKICVRKCCEFGFGYDFVNRKCVSVNESFDPPIWDGFKLLKQEKASSRFHFLYGKPLCKGDELRIRIRQIYDHMHIRTVSIERT